MFICVPRRKIGLTPEICLISVAEMKFKTSVVFALFGLARANELFQYLISFAPGRDDCAYGEVLLNQGYSLSDKFTMDDYSTCSTCQSKYLQSKYINYSASIQIDAKTIFLFYLT